MFPDVLEPEKYNGVPFWMVVASMFFPDITKSCACSATLSPHSKPVAVENRICPLVPGVLLLS